MENGPPSHFREGLLSHESVSCRLWLRWPLGNCFLISHVIRSAGKLFSVPPGLHRKPNVMIAIIDYGMGNLRSVQKAIEQIGSQAVICDRPDQLQRHAKWILPGVGAFRDAMTALKEHGFVDSIREHIQAERPLLGICLGLQLLFDVSYEDGEHTGLEIVSGKVVRFESQPGLRIPHMGWNTIRIRRTNPLLADIADGAYFYFVHSYHVVPEQEADIALETVHGQPFVSMIARGNLFATQFHPEKSQQVGLRLLENFAKL